MFYGPTTRKAWSEYIARASETKPQASTQSCNSQNENSSNEESPKEGASANRNMVKRNKKKPGRPRKYAPGVSAVVKRAATGSKKVAGINEPRRPGRPPKSPKKRAEPNSLDMLHAQTLLSISSSAGVRTSPAPGTVDQKLDSASSLSNTPSVAVKHSSYVSMEEALETLVERFRLQFIQFMSYMQLPEYKISVARQIELERKRNNMLTSQVNAAEKSVRILQERGVASLKAKLLEVGITAMTSDDVLNRARELIHKNKVLIEKEARMSAELAHQEAIFMEIGKAYEKLKGVDPKMFPEVAANLEKHKRLLYSDGGRMDNSLEKMLRPSQRGTPSQATSGLNLASALKELPLPISNASDQVNNLIIAQLKSAPGGKGPRGSRKNSADASVGTKSAVESPIVSSAPIKVKREPKKRVAKVPVTGIVQSGSLFNGSIVAKSQSLCFPPIDETKVDQEIVSQVNKISAKSVDSPKPNQNKKNAKAVDHLDEKAPVKGSHKSRENSPRHVSSLSSKDIPAYIPSATIKTSPPQEGVDGKERLTLTLVLDRRDNSASVKSPSKSPPNKSPQNSASYMIANSSHKSSPKHQVEALKRKAGSSSPSEEKLTKKSR